MSSFPTCLFIVTVEGDAAVEADWNRWYDDVHLPAALARPGVLHGSYSYLLQDPDGQVQEAHSISAGLDYPGVGPEHAFLSDSGRVRYVSATDREALDAFQECTRQEGIIPALETSHALAALPHLADELTGPVVVCFSGRGDKDVDAVAAAVGL